MEKKINNSIIAIIIISFFIISCNSSKKNRLSDPLESTKSITKISFLIANNNNPYEDLYELKEDIVLTEENFSGTFPEIIIKIDTPYGTNPLNLKAEIEHTGISIFPENLEKLDFSSPKKFTVTAEDGSAQEYTLKLISSSKSILSYGFKKIDNPTFDEDEDIEAEITDNKITALVPVCSPILVASFKHSGKKISLIDNDNEQQSSITINDFTSPLVYRVTAEDDTYQDYTAEVAVSNCWKDPELIETNNEGHAQSPEIAMDSNGNALVIWEQYENSTQRIWSNTYVPEYGWGVASPIVTNNNEMAYGHKLAMTPSGTAMAIWTQKDGTQDSIWSNRYDPASGWGTSELVEIDNNGFACYPAISIKSSGDAIAVWNQWSGTMIHIFSNIYIHGSGWQTPLVIDNNSDEENSLYPQIVMNESGNALALWYQYDGTSVSLWVNTYSPLTRWNSAKKIKTTNSIIEYSYKSAMDPFGNAIIIWTQKDGTVKNLWSCRYSPETGWGSAELLEDDETGNADQLQVAMDKAGNIIVAWKHQIKHSKGTRWAILSKQYSAQTGWGAIEIIDENNTLSSSGLSLAMNDAGKAILVWSQYDPIRKITRISSNMFLPGKGWYFYELLDEIENASVGISYAAINDSGKGFFAWQQMIDNLFDILVSGSNF